MNKITGLRNKLALPILIISIAFAGCIRREAAASTDKQADWRNQFGQKLQLLGHRNWILIVDKAFPEQNAPGIQYINTDEDLLPVLEYTLNKIKNSRHIKPVIYKDKELSFITEAQSSGVEAFRQQSEKILRQAGVNTIPHDSIFSKLDQESRLFKVLVLKTNETIPYTSVFLQLDCAYWNSDKEKALRQRMKQVATSLE